MIEIHSHTDDIKDLLQVLKVLPNGLEKAVTRAINKSLVSTRTYMVKVVREDYAMKAGNVRNALEIRKATWQSLHGIVHGEGSPGIPLFAFARTKKIPSTKRLKTFIKTKAGYWTRGFTPEVGIPVLVNKRRGKKKARGVFLAKMSSGHIGAFRRIDGVDSGGKQLIREAYGPSPIKILASDQYDEQIENYADDLFQKNLKREADFVLTQMGLL